MPSLAIVVSLLASVNLALQPPPSTSVHWVTTGCELVSTEPVQYRVEFTIVNDDPAVQICDFRLELDEIVDGESERALCEFDSCETPEGWGCNLLPEESAPGADFLVQYEEDCVDPGETLEGFVLFLSDPWCCYKVTATGPEWRPA